MSGCSRHRTVDETSTTSGWAATGGDSSRPGPLDGLSADHTGQLRAHLKSAAVKRGDEPLRIMHRAGHKDLTTTMGYVREAENLRAGFGTVLPPSLFGTGGSPS